MIYHHLVDLYHLFVCSQPHTSTKAANQLDAADPRSAGLKHIINLLKDISCPPKWIFLENVKGFHGSDMQNRLQIVLKSRNYSWRQYLLSPVQFGIPNNRKRYYLLCEYGDRFLEDRENIFTDFPSSLMSGYTTDVDEGPGETRTSGHINCLCEYVTELPVEEGLQSSDLYLDQITLSKPWAKGLSVVSPFDKTTFCFTGSYGKVFHKSSGTIC
jgi:tRNA (cytosine38-C5)-methyltransferase